MPANKDGPGEREEPDWMKSFKSPTSQALNADDDSDDGIMDIFQRHKTEEKFEMKSTPAKMVRSPPANAPKVEDGDKDDEDVEDEPIEIDDDDDDDDEAAGDGDGDDDEEPAAKTKPKTPTPKKLGSQSANADRASVRAQAEKTAGTSTPNRPGEVPLFMPSTVNRNKVFFELEGTGEAVDLEGDVGVVGRLLSNASEKHGSGLQMDMKGVIYNARILPTPVQRRHPRRQRKRSQSGIDHARLRAAETGPGGERRIGSDARWVPGRRQRRRGGRAQGRGGTRGGGGCAGYG